MNIVSNEKVNFNSLEENTYKNMMKLGRKIIQDELKKLSMEFDRYRDRWDKLSKSIDTVNKEVKDIHVTTEKITKRFDSINKVEIAVKDNYEKLE